MTLLLANLVLCMVGSGQTTEEGEINGAAFFIDIPENWNGGLVM